ncbi:hypothetical protein N7G274_000359 [Stereocaulon virgatum]|uniref:Uncharacterized protein n=1 Tax=Stereocaulon virgatum TaxID=373712 RepID=A0ABR4ARX1_9LECA
MTDVQSWRRHTQLAKIRSTESHACGSPPDDNYSSSTSPTDTTKPRPRRSLASFALYLSTHRVTPSSSQPEWPSIDWSTLNEKDNVYRPDPDHMCTTLRRHLLANPSDDLPAQYNSFVLHVIEDYQRVKSEKNDLGRNLQVEQQCHQNDVNEFQQVVTWSKPDATKVAINADSRFNASTGHGDGQILESKQNPNGKPLALLPRVDTGYIRKRLGNVRIEGSSTALNHHASHQRSSQFSCHGSATAASESNFDSRPHSGPLSDTTPQDFSPSNTESESSSDDEGHIALTSIALAANEYSNKGRLLSQQFEYRDDYHPDNPSSKKSAVPSSSNGFQPDRSSKPAATTSSDMAPTKPTATATMKLTGPRRLTKKAYVQTGLLTAEETRRRRQHRGFSFIPGDDFGLLMRPTSPGAESQGTHSRTSTPLTPVRDESHDWKASDDSWGGPWMAEFAPDLDSYPQLTKPVISLTEREQKSRVFKREGSSKSVLTAIKESSSRSSSLSHKDSMGNSNSKGGSLATQKTTGENSFAIAAAARATRNR